MQSAQPFRRGGGSGGGNAFQRTSDHRPPPLGAGAKRAINEISASTDDPYADLQHSAAIQPFDSYSYSEQPDLTYQYNPGDYAEYEEDE
jgi:hypothetical protein